MRALLIAVLALVLAAPVRAQDPKAFKLELPQEWITLVVKQALVDAQVNIRGRGRRVPVDDVSISFESGRKVVFTLRTDIETVKELAKDESGAVATALNRFLNRVSDDYQLVFRFNGRLAIGPSDRPRDATLAIDFDQSDIQLELHRNGARTASAPAPLEKLGLWLLHKYVQKIPVASSFEITTHLNWTWRGHWLSAKGHRILARFIFERFPFVPFSLDRVETEDRALQAHGRRE
jgi:hypothetical protein